MNWENIIKYGELQRDPTPRKYSGSNARPIREDKKEYSDAEIKESFKTEISRIEKEIANMTKELDGMKTYFNQLVKDFRDFIKDPEAHRESGDYDGYDPREMSDYGRK